MCDPWSARRALLDELAIERPGVRLSDVFDDGQALFDAVVEHRLEGVVAKRRNGIYRPGYRGWTKIKEPDVLAPRDRVELIRRRHIDRTAGRREAPHSTPSGFVSDEGGRPCRPSL